MDFLEKDLEAIIWEYAPECEARGFSILQMEHFSQGRRFRQMQLGPYGIADLVHVYYNPHINQFWIQVIECKRNKVNAETYLQAKRYVSAVKDAVFSSDMPVCKIATSVILVGASVDTSSPLAHVIANDPDCHTYTYKYAVDGIHFEDQGFLWRAETYLEMPSFFERTIRAFDEYRTKEQATYNGFVLEHGNPSSPLLITAAGVLLNTELLAI
jgi:hypothetical protein